MKKYNFKETYLNESFFDDIEDDINDIDSYITTNIESLINYIIVVSKTDTFTLFLQGEKKIFNCIPNKPYKVNIDPNITSLYQLFMWDKNNIISIDFTYFDSSKITNMSAMFANCEALTSVNLTNFDTSNVTDMEVMFSSCNKLTSLDVSSFNTSNVTNMKEMFNDCKLLTSLDLSSFDTSNVTNMYGMFGGCESLTTLDVSSFNTFNVTNMAYMFIHCYMLTSIDLTNFDISNLKDKEYYYYREMFKKCKSLSYIKCSTDIRNWCCENSRILNLSKSKIKFICK